MRFKILLSAYITIMQEVKGKDGAGGQKTVENREGKRKFWLITYLICNEEETYVTANKFPSDRSANVGTTAFADGSPGNRTQQGREEREMASGSGPLWLMSREVASTLGRAAGCFVIVQ